MLSKLVKYLQYEQGLIKEMIELAQKQQTALVTFDTASLERITFRQETLSNKLREAEAMRVNLLIQWLKISKQDAMNLRMSTIEKQLKNNEERIAMKALRIKIMALLKKLHTFNNLNRSLANRARNSVRETLSYLTNNGKHVCNVKV